MARNDYSQVKAYTAPKAQAAAPNLTQMLAANIKQIKSALPKHLSAERICRVALNFISKNPQLQKCTPQSLCGAIMEASTLGLEIDMRGLAYLVPYGTAAQLSIGYKGLIDLAVRSGKVKQIYGECIYENDIYDIVLGLEPKLVHKPRLTDRGGVIASYAIAVLADGTKQFMVVPRAEIDKVREASKAGHSGPWEQWFEQMAIKTAVRRLCKFLPLSAEMQRAVALDEAVDAHTIQTFAYDIDVPEAPAEEQAAEDAVSGIECPKTGEQVTEDKCKDCPDYRNCSQWEPAE